MQSINVWPPNTFYSPQHCSSCKLANIKDHICVIACMLKHVKSQYQANGQVGLVKTFVTNWSSKKEHENQEESELKFL